MNINFNNTAFFVVIIFIQKSLYCQDIPELLSNENYSCVNVIDNSMRLIPHYHNNNQFDSLNLTLENWEKTCGMSEPLLRFKILFAIKQNNFSEALYDTLSITEYWRNYNKRIKYKSFDGGIPTGYKYLNAYDSFTENFAKNLKIRRSQSTTDVENFFLDLYSDNFYLSYDKIRYGDFMDSKLKQDFHQDIGRWRNIKFSSSIFTGIWLPLGNIKTLGNHPIIGISSGVGYKKWSFDMILEWRFLKSPNYYLVESFDSVYSTNRFFGGLYGVQLGYEIFQKDNTKIFVSAGYGFDSFDSVQIPHPDRPGERHTKTINSRNTNFGFEYRKYHNYTSFWGLGLRYNLVNYDNPNGTDLSGNTINIRLKYGC